MVSCPPKRLGHLRDGRAHKGQKCPADIKDSIGNVLLYMYSETCDDEVIRAVHEKKLWPQRAPQSPTSLPSQSAPSVPSSRPLAPESSCFGNELKFADSAVVEEFTC